MIIKIQLIKCLYFNKPLNGLVILLCALILCSGCETISYYYQASNGQLDILAKRQNIQTLLNKEDANLTTEDREKLQLVLQVRDFASNKLSLPVGKAYSSYSDIQKSHVVWNVFATDELSVNAKQWCYPIIGCASYRGYFKKANAENYAAKLAAKGYDTHISGVRAYSTLGWFNDPVLNGFLELNSLRLAGLLFHEIAHRVVYINGDTDFNESFATSVELFAVQQWAKQQAIPDSQIKQYLERLEKQLKFVDIVTEYREQLNTLYTSNHDKKYKHQQKTTILDDLQEHINTLIKNHQISDGYQRWAKQLNNAKLVPINSYYRWLNASQHKLHQSLLAHNCDPSYDLLTSKKCNSGLQTYYAEVKSLGKLPRDERIKILTQWQIAATQSGSVLDVSP